MAQSRIRFEKVGLWQNALQLFQDISTARLRPNGVSLNSLMCCLEKAGQWQLALLSLRRCPITTGPDLFSFNSAISSCEKGAQWQWALQILDVMVSGSHTPDTISFSAAISSVGTVQFSADERIFIWFW
eukprot:Skav236833  [mRNA]  locus=scaffold1027:25194:25580:+ [translate_table: standard]